MESMLGQTSMFICYGSCRPFANQVRFGNRYFENLNAEEEVPGKLGFSCLSYRS